jgi:hypothetical protein
MNTQGRMDKAGADQRRLMFVAAIGVPFAVLAACVPITIALSRVSTSAATVLGTFAIPLSALLGLLCAMRAVRQHRFLIAVIYMPLMVLVLWYIAIHLGFSVLGDSL